MMRKKCGVISVLLVICLVISMLPVHAIATEADGEEFVPAQALPAAYGDIMDEQEPNDEQEQANHIPSSVTTVGGGVWSYLNDVEDWFVFDVPARAVIDLTVEATSDELVILVKNVGLGVPTDIGDGWYRYTIQNADGYLYALDAGSYYINILESSEESIRYIIRLEMDVCEHPDKTGTTVEPTCTEDGYIHYVCADCNGIWDEKNVDALGHTAVNSKVTAPTCTEQGYTTSDCTRCGVQYDHQFVPALGHTEVVDIAVSATCTVEGWTEGGHCCNCGIILNPQESIPALGHTERLISDAVAPTCEEAGLTAWIDCSVCGEVLSEQKTAPALGHTVVREPYVAPTCTQSGLTEGSYCSECGKVLQTRETIPATGEHTVVIDPAVDPTCTEYGLTEGKHCSVCGEVLIAQETITTLLPHTESITRPEILATCTQYGLEAYIHCGTCGKTLQNGSQYIREHNYVDNICTYCGRSKVPDISWELSGSTLTISGTGGMADYSNSSPPWKAETSNIRTVVIEEGITSIGEYAFYYCENLTGVTLPDSLISIGEAAFYGCRSLRSVDLPENLKEIGDHAFQSCSNLSSITFPEGLRRIGMQAFYECTGLKNVVLPDSVAHIGERTFYMCSSLYSVVMPKELAFIYPNMFEWCTSLESVKLPDSLRSIDSDAFHGCSSLKEITFPESLHEILDGAFAHCTGLTSLVLPAAIDRICNSAFYGSSNLSTITMKGPAPELETSAFSGLTATVYYPSNEISWVQAVQKQYGGNITWKENLVSSGSLGRNVQWNYTGYNATLTISGSGRIPDCLNDAVPWLSRRSKIKTVIIEAGITGIGKAVFKDCTGLTSVTLPATLAGNGIDEGAFMGCTGLSSITLPDGVTSIGIRAFYGCTGLRSITLPAGLNHIAAAAFGGCIGLTEIRFGGEMPYYIGDKAFEGVNAAVYFPVDDPSWTEDAMQNLGLNVEWIPYYPATGSCGAEASWEYDPDTRILTVSGTGAMENYSGAGAAPWSAAKTILEAVVIGEGITQIGDYAFLDCSSLVSLTLPDSLTRIGSSAFRNCGTMSCITVPENVISIGVAAFAGCGNLSEINFVNHAPDQIGESAFYNVTARVHYPGTDPSWTDAMRKNYGGRINWIATGMVENRLLLDAAELNGHTSVWIDGREYEVLKDGDISYVELPDGNAKIMILHIYNSGTKIRYPVGMKVWILENENGVYTATRQECFDDILQYSGMSIRVAGDKGIRMITSIEQKKKDALTAGGLVGYTLKEYGTMAAWKALLGDEPLVHGKPYTKSNYAYKRGIADPVFAYDGDLMQYTNVLVGFSNAQCRNDLAMRPYMILEDAEGDEITIYGGIVIRSIGYIALQNKDTFDEGTKAYHYVWDIIHSVYGDTYDEVNAS